jgi:excinuclease UvrABC nuclease subunit
MDDRLEKLAEKAKGLPRAPGVYLMKDDKGRVIYIGKSASLRDRVCSYFQPSTKLDYKKAPLRDVAGMLRSASYAAHAALQAEVATRLREHLDGISD